MCPGRTRLTVQLNLQLWELSREGSLLPTVIDLLVANTGPSFATANIKLGAHIIPSDDLPLLDGAPYATTTSHAAPNLRQSMKLSGECGHGPRDAALIRRGLDVVGAVNFPRSSLHQSSATRWHIFTAAGCDIPVYRHPSSSSIRDSRVPGAFDSSSDDNRPATSHKDSLRLCRILRVQSSRAAVPTTTPPRPLGQKATGSSLPIPLSIPMIGTSRGWSATSRALSSHMLPVFPTENPYPPDHKLLQRILQGLSADRPGLDVTLPLIPAAGPQPRLFLLTLLTAEPSDPLLLGLWSCELRGDYATAASTAHVRFGPPRLIHGIYHRPRL